MIFQDWIAAAPGLVADDDDLCMGRDLPADARPTAFVDRRRWQCAWPIEAVETPGHARMLCCGAPALPISPYCAGHAARARREPLAAPPVATATPSFEAPVIRRFAA
jgi:hypothetical protein